MTVIVLVLKLNVTVMHGPKMLFQLKLSVMCVVPICPKMFAVVSVFQVKLQLNVSVFQLKMCVVHVPVEDVAKDVCLECVFSS